MYCFSLELEINELSKGILFEMILSGSYDAPHFSAFLQCFICIQLVIIEVECRNLYNYKSPLC